MLSFRLTFYKYVWNIVRMDSNQEEEVCVEIAEEELDYQERHCGPLLLRRTTDHVKLCGSRQAVWQQNTLWTAPLGENHRCRQAVWQPSSCVAANIYCGTLLWRRTTDEVKLYGSQQAVWQQKYTEDLSF